MKRNIRNRLNHAYNKKQNGLVAIFLVVAMVLILGMAGLVIDVDDTVLNKARLQNGTDAAALAAASYAADNMEADTDRIVVANAALDAFVQYQSNIENASVALSLGTPAAIGNTVTYNGTGDNNTVVLTVQFANDAEDFFNPGTVDYTDDIYVRVHVTSLDLPEYLIALLDVDKKISASAVAGPSSSSECEIFPMAVCALTEDAGSDGFYGYEEGKSYVMYETPSNASDMGPGNYQLLDVGVAGDLDKSLAGDLIMCLDLNTYTSDDLEVTLLQVDSETGQKKGLVDGVNTRFNEHTNQLSAEDYPSDIYIEEYDVETVIEVAMQDAINIALDGTGYFELADLIQDEKDAGNVTDADLSDVFSDTTSVPDTIIEKARGDVLDPDGDGSESITTDFFSDYSNAVAACVLDPSGDYCQNGDPDQDGFPGQIGRRVVTIPILDCDIGNSGKGTFNVEQLGCFFLTDSIGTNSGNEAGEFYGEFTADCDPTYATSGVSGLKAAYRIVLYKDPHSDRS